MTGDTIRQKFLSFFEDRGHKILPGSSLVPEDPTLLLTTAGMVQFKPIFEGVEKPTYPRVATCQRCVRTTDIDQVGKTARHLTFFEMLGNFSFGDYYKEEIIPWSWEFLTGDLALDPDRLWVSVYESDDESRTIWKRKVGIPESRIVGLGEKDNFWAAGPTGPCGPCTEIIYDLGEEVGCGKHDCAVDCGCDRFLELWNLVFMQYNQAEDGARTELKQKGVDTGLGLERAASVLQGARTNFETDLLRPLIESAAGVAGVVYGQDNSSDTSLKIIADHARAITFLTSDGVLPSNESRGYVLRRLLRRAVRHGRLLSIEKVFMPEMCEQVIAVMSNAYADVKRNRDAIIRAVESEEERFAATLKSGLGMLEDIIDEINSSNGAQVGGDVVFRLYDTYGFPPELTAEISAENGLEVDLDGFSAAMAVHKQEAQKSWKQQGERDRSAYNVVLDEVGQTEFAGHESRSTPATVTAVLKGGRAVAEARAGEEVEVVLDRTPFYGEMGGQVGDRGRLQGEGGVAEVADTQVPVDGLYVHASAITEGRMRAGDKVQAIVEQRRRFLTERNHTATHIVHWALRKVLGEHVRQAGSHVGPERFRFDFSHFKAVTDDELAQIEDAANERIAEAALVTGETKSLDAARREGALAFFGEKYGEEVRVLKIGDFSSELCGGTHVGNTAEIQVVKIVSEGSVGANLRRIEGLSSLGAINYLNEDQRALKRVADSLGVEKDQVDKGVKSILEGQKEKERLIQKLQAAQMVDEAAQIVQTAAEIGGVKVAASQINEASADHLRALVDSVREKIGDGVVILGSTHPGKALVVAGVTKQLVADGVSAKSILDVVAPVVGGGGGGRADLAQAGGGKPENLSQAIRSGVEYVRSILADGKK